MPEQTVEEVVSEINADTYADATIRTECDYEQARERLLGKFPVGSEWNIQSQIATQSLEQMLINGIQSGRVFDRLKKVLFYGATHEKNGNRLVLTMHPHTFGTTDEYWKAAAKRAGNPQAIRLMHSFIGLHTESAEGFEALYNYIYAGTPLDEVNMFEELGDACWYIGIGCKAIAVTLTQVLRRNIAKLFKRYPEKFSLEQSLNRDTVAERAVLEANTQLAPEEPPAEPAEAGVITIPEPAEEQTPEIPVNDIPVAETVPELVTNS